MRGKIIVLFMFAAFGNLVYAGEIYRCVAASGELTFTNVGCPEKTLVQHVGSYEPVPDSPMPTYQAGAAAAAISARQAREAAQQAQAAAEYVQANYQAQADMQSDQQSIDGDVYALGLAPLLYAQRISRLSSIRGPQRPVLTRSSSRLISSSARLH